MLRAFLVAAPLWAQTAEPPPPNFVLLLADDQGWNATSVELEPGVETSRSDMHRTPNLERLARDGMRFSRAYSAGPNCSPSRAALLTGSAPARLGMTDVVRRMTQVGTSARADRIPGARLATPTSLRELPAEATTLPELLKRTGHRSGHFGKWHLGRVSPAEHGFDRAEVRFPDPLGGSALDADPKGVFEVSDAAVAFIAECAEAGEPFYAQVWYDAVHRPLQARPATLAEERARPRGARHDDAAYAALTHDLDAAVGVVLDALDELDLAGDTYVLYTSDNGGSDHATTNRPLVSGKGSLYEGGLRVPLFVRGPRVPAGSACADPVVGHDLFATVADWAGLSEATSDAVDGVSLVDAIESGGAAPVERASGLVFHFPHYAPRLLGVERPASALIEGDRKLIRFDDPGELLLFDVAEPRGERANLADLFPDEAAAMERRLDALLSSLGAERVAPLPEGLDR